MQDSKHSKGNTALIIIITLILALLIISLLFWMQYQNFQSAKKDLQGNGNELQEKLNQFENDLLNDNPLQTESNETSDQEQMMTYKNSFFNFTIDYPNKKQLCLDDFCSNQSKLVSDEMIDYINIKEYNVFNVFINPSKNETGITAIEFAKMQEKVNSDLGYVIKGGQKTTFVNEPAYTFEVARGFEQKGYEFFDSGTMSIKLGDGYSGKEILSPEIVIYFEKNGYLFQIDYTKNNKTAEKIINSFKFVE